MANQISKVGRELSNKLSSADNGFISPILCTRLNRLAKQYNRIQEKWCSVQMTERQKKSLEKSEARIEKEIKDIIYVCAGIVSVKFGGDPRGFCVKLMLLDERYNTWGGKEDGWGIGE